MKKTNQILIVGAGPTGLAMAVFCQQYKLPFRLIDKSPSPSIYSKALVMQARTQEVMAQAGLIDKMLQAGERVQIVTFRIDNKVQLRIDLDKVQSPYGYPLMIEQSCTEHILIDYLKKHGIVVERECELIDLQQDISHVTVTIQKPDKTFEKQEYEYVIGCDGAHSAVRKLLHLPFSGSTYDERFFLADLKVDWNNQPHEVFGYVNNGRLGALIPLKNGYYRLIGILPPDFVPKNLPQDTTLDQKTLTLDDLQKLCQHFIPIPIKLHSPQWIAVFRSHRRLVKEFRVNRVFLAGDAAHVHSPAGGQGMNTGIQDVHNLVWKLALIMQHKAQESLLDSYHQERYPVAQSVLHYTDLAFKNVTLKNPVLKKIRDFILPFLLKSKKIQKILRNAIAELSITYHKSMLNVYGREKNLGWGPIVGQRAPDLKAVDQQGGYVSILSLMSYLSHSFLIFLPFDSDIDIQAALKQLQAYSWAKIIVITSPDYNATSFDKIPWLTDDLGLMANRYGIRDKAALYLVRPDGYIAGRSCMDNDAYIKMIDTYKKIIS